MDPHFEFIALSPDDAEQPTLALGCSNLTGRLWSGSVWLHPVPALSSAPAPALSAAPNSTSSPTLNSAPNCVPSPALIPDLTHHPASLHRPDPAKSIASYSFEGGCPHGAWLSPTALAVAEDGGAVSWLTAADGVLCCAAVSRAHGATVSAMALTAGGGRLATAGADGNIALHCPATHRPAARYSPAHAQPCTALAPRPLSAPCLASAALDGNVLLWDTRLPRPASGLHRNPDNPVTALAWHSDTQLLLGCLCGGVRLCDVRRPRGDWAGCAALGGAVRRLRGRSDRPTEFAVCGDDTAVVVVGVNGGEVTKRWQQRAHTDVVTDVAWLSPHTLLSCAADSSLRTATPQLGAAC